MKGLITVIKGGETRVISRWRKRGGPGDAEHMLQEKLWGGITEVCPSEFSFPKV